MPPAAPPALVDRFGFAEVALVLERGLFGRDTVGVGDLGTALAGPSLARVGHLRLLAGLPRARSLALASLARHLVLRIDVRPGCPRPQPRAANGPGLLPEPASPVTPDMHSRGMDISPATSDTDSAAADADRRTPRRWHSVSSTREYEGCPRRYRYGCLDKRPRDRPAPVSWRFGSAVRAGLESAYRPRLDDADGGIVEHLAAASTAIDDCWRKLGLDSDSDDEGRTRATTPRVRPRSPRPWATTRWRRPCTACTALPR